MPEWITDFHQIWIFLSPIVAGVICYLIRPTINLVVFVYNKYIQKPDADNRNNIEIILDDLDEIKEELEHSRDRDRAVLHHEIFLICKNALKKGYITDFEFKNLDGLYQEYKAIGGNGTAKKFYEDCLKLPNKEIE